LYFYKPFPYKWLHPRTSKNFKLLKNQIIQIGDTLVIPQAKHINLNKNVDLSLNHTRNYMNKKIQGNDPFLY